MSMAATTTQTAHASVSALLNVRQQLERYVISRLLLSDRPFKRSHETYHGSFYGQLASSKPANDPYPFYDERRWLQTFPMSCFQE